MPPTHTYTSSPSNVGVTARAQNVPKMFFPQVSNSSDNGHRNDLRFGPFVFIYRTHGEKKRAFEKGGEEIYIYKKVEVGGGGGGRGLRLLICSNSFFEKVQVIPVDRILAAEGQEAHNNTRTHNSRYCIQLTS